ncbi:MAG: HTTM domain-containing protein, partial [Isosphaeraceae bacterium]
MTPWRLWDRFWFTPTSARPLGAIRILFGLTWLLNLALLIPDADYWLSSAGMLRGGEVRELAGPWRPSPLQWVQDPAAVHAFLALSAVIGVLFTLGWRTRINGILLYLATISIHHRNLLTASGADCLLAILAFLLMLSPCGAAYSLDARRTARRLGAWFEPLIATWPLRLIQIQISLIYLTTACLKSAGEDWLDGSALHYVLNNGEVSRFTFGLDQLPQVTCWLTYAALAVEFALVVFPWFRKTRPWVLLLGLGLHGSILLTVNIPIFGELMCLSYLAFLTPAEFDALLRLVRPRILTRQTPHAPFPPPS